MLDFSFPVIELSTQLNKTHQAIHKLCNEHNIEVNTGRGRSYFSPQSIRKYLKHFYFNYPKKIISFQACKGGVGKTSLCFNIATRAVQYGAKVLVVDMDMQAHLTMALLNPQDTKFLVWQDILSGKAIEETILEIHPHLHIIPSHLDNSYIDKSISQSHKIIYKSYVQEHLDKVKSDYDLIFIDCSPSLSHINTAIAIASNIIFIPVNPDVFSFDGLEKTIAELKEIQLSFNNDADITVILNRFDAREKNSLDVIANLKNMYGELLFPTVVVVSAEIKNSIARQELIFNSKPRPNVAVDIDEIVKNILNIDRIKDAKVI